MNHATLALYILTAALALVQLFDLWTTSEIIKRKYGHEANPTLAVLNDPALPWHRRYWILAGVKGIVIAALAFLCWYAPRVPEWVVWLWCATNVGLLAYYLPVMANNWKIYHEAKTKLEAR